MVFHGKREQAKATIVASTCSVRMVDRGSFGPVLRSLNVTRLRQFDTVLGLCRTPGSVAKVKLVIVWAIPQTEGRMAPIIAAVKATGGGVLML